MEIQALVTFETTNGTSTMTSSFVIASEGLIVGSSLVAIAIIIYKGVKIYEKKLDKKANLYFYRC